MNVKHVEIHTIRVKKTLDGLKSDEYFYNTLYGYNHNLLLRYLIICKNMRKQPINL